MSSKTKAFTLIEVLVVIAVIAVLAGVTLFAISDSRKQAEAAATLKQLEQVREAFLLYARTKRLDEWPGANGAGGGYAHLDNIIDGSHTPVLFPDFGEYIGGYDLPEYMVVRFDNRVSEGPFHSNNAMEYTCDYASEGYHYYWSGVNLRITASGGKEQELHDLFVTMNQMIDGDDPDHGPGCGVLRASPVGASGAVYFLIAEGPFDTY